METTLSSKQKKYLKSQAHSLKPTVLIGKSGASEQSMLSISEALSHHELIKIKFIAFKEEKEALVDQILEATDAHFVSMLGHVLTLYCEHKEVEERSYKLPQ